MDSSQVEAVLERSFPWLFAAMVLATIAIAGIRAILKRRRGEFVLRPILANALFDETWVSGGTGLLSSARNCLWVTLTDDALFIGLHFPFSVFVPRWFGLEAKITPGNVIAIENRQTFLQGSLLAIRFRDGDGRPRTIDLKLRREDTFVRHLRDVCRVHGKAV